MLNLQKVLITHNGSPVFTSQKRMLESEAHNILYFSLFCIQKKVYG